MFPKEVYWQRRKLLRDLLGEGLILFPGNEDSAMNYKSNVYHFRQDSSFLYFFGINKPGFYGVCDVDTGKDTLYGEDFTIGDIIWMGDQPSVNELATGVAADSSVYNHQAYCPLYANLANSKGGGILLENNSTGTIAGTAAFIGFKDPYGPNVVTNGDGGGIYVSDSILTISNQDRSEKL